MIQVQIENDILQKHPHVCVGVLFARGIDNTRPSTAIMERIRAEEKRIRNELTLETLSQHPKVACWREAYRAFGAKPSEYRSSIENLNKRILKGEEIRSINPLVDIYNLISIKHFLPLGGEDLNVIQGTVRLRAATANETPVKLLGEPDARPPNKGEIIYADDVGTLCRRWNWKEAERTKLTEKTTTALLIIDAIAPITREEVHMALVELEKEIAQHTGAQTQAIILDASHPTGSQT